MAYAVSVTVNRPFDEVVDQVRQALGEQGFGVITEIDMKATLKKKIDVDIEPQIILGACNPPAAHHALQAEPSVGVLLPCNVVVRAAGDTTIVEAIDTATMVELTGNPAMASVADDIGARLKSALDSIAA